MLIPGNRICESVLLKRLQGEDITWRLACQLADFGSSAKRLCWVDLEEYGMVIRVYRAAATSDTVSDWVYRNRMGMPALSPPADLRLLLEKCEK